MKIELTPRLVDALGVEPGRTRTIYFDIARSAPKGFCLRVTANGARSYYLVKTSKATKERLWLHLGDADGISLDGAREAAQARAGEVALGKNPNREARLARAVVDAERLQRQADAKEWTVAQMVRSYIGAKRLQAITVKNYTRFLEHDIEPAELGTKNAREVVRDDVRQFIGHIGKRAPAVAEAVLMILRASFRWAQDEEVLIELPGGKRETRQRVDRDPTRRIEEGIPSKVLRGRKVRTRHLSDDEIKRYWPAVDSLKLTRSTFARVILLTGTRSTETYKARWRDIRLDGDAPTWHVPAVNRKGRLEGSGEKRPVDVPLSPLAVKLLRALHEVTGTRERVFVAEGISHAQIGSELRYAACTIEAHRSKAYRSDTKLLSNATHHPKPTDCLGDVTIHDLRRSVASGLQRLGAPPHVISVVLGHTREAGATQTDAAYTHDRRPAEHRLWLEKWSAHVEGILGAEGERKVITGSFGR
jgi:integrase